jgi:hypothetical protein
MKTRPRSLRVLVLLLIAVGALAALVVGIGSAGASPAVAPTISTQVPLDGALVQASEEPIKVVFTCPGYVLAAGEPIEEEGEGTEEGEEGEEGEEPAPPAPPVLGPPTLGGGEEYGVHFSTSAGVGTDGKLGTAGFGEGGEGEAEEVKGSAGVCSSELELPTKPLPAALYSGRIYWQAYRASEVAADGVEVGPVRSFVVYPHVEEPELIFREQIFAGYLTKVGLGYESELGGAVVQLQEWNGSAWETLAEAPGSDKGENSFFIKIKEAGHHLFRAYVPSSSPALGLEPVAKAIRPVTKARVTGPADDGAYVAASEAAREESPVAFGVSNGGRLLRNMTAEIEVICKGQTKAKDVTIEIPAHLEHARIAPDGTVFGVTKTQGAEAWTITLTGSLFAGRFQGELSTAHANCSGARVIDAIRKTSVKS